MMTNSMLLTPNRPTVSMLVASPFARPGRVPVSLRWLARREAAASSSAVVYFVYWDAGELRHVRGELETYIEVLVWDAENLEVRVLADSLCDELVQGEDVWHGCGAGRLMRASAYYLSVQRPDCRRVGS